MTFKRVVAATDFSEPSDRALGVAARWSDKLGVPLTVLHTYDPGPIGPSAALPFPAWPTQAGAKAIQREAVKRLEALSEGVLSGVSHQVEAKAHPSASLGICDFVAPDDLLVVGTHGRTGVKRLLLGSVAEQTIRHAPCTVLAVRGDFDVETFPENILVCTDFSEAALPALGTAARVAKAFDKPVELLHVERTDEWKQATDTATPEQLAKVDAELRGALDALHAKHLPPPVNTQFVVADHRPDGIVDHAKQDHFDLIIIATHGRTGLSRLVIGSVTERVTRIAHCPVLVERSSKADADEED